MSIPFAHKPFTLSNPDGTRIEVQGWGDQNFAVFESDGYTVVPNPETGYYDYAMLAQDQASLIPSGVRVGSADPKSLGLQPGLRPTPHAIRGLALAGQQALGTRRRWEIRRENRRTGLQQALKLAGPLTAPPSEARTGAYTGLCLLVRFPDVPDTIPQQEVADFCNKRGYSNYGNNGSVYDYYLDNSAGRLQYTNIVPPYYTAKHPRAYYTDPAVPCGVRAQELIREALDDLKAKQFDFSRLSSDEDGYVYALNVFYAGGLVNQWAKGLWPHSSAMGGYQAGSGKTFSDYQITNMGDELSLETFCHENGHMLCDFPDLYDYGYESNGNGQYCLMAYGGPDPKNPVSVCAYLKYKAGWATQVTRITDGMTATAPAGQNRFFLYGVPNRPTEYFLLENLQQSGRNVGLPDAGLAIWHVDELGSNNWEQMSPSQHYECALEQADNQFHLERRANYGDGNDLFAAPAAAQFTAATAPSSKWWDGSPSGLNIVQISPPAPVMTFTQADTAAPFATQLCQVNNADGRLEVFSIGTNSALYHNWQVVQNGGWHGGVALGGMARQVVAGRNQDGRCEIFYVGTNSKIYHSWQVAPNGDWIVDQPLGGAAKQIAVANNADGRLEIFYIGTNDQIYHNWQTRPNNGWSGECPMGGAAKQITVGRNADGRLEIFYVGTNDRIYHNWQIVPNGGWSGEASLGGLAKQISVGRNADGRLEIFYVGTNDRIYHNWQTAPNSGWSGEAALGGLAKQLTLEKNADGRLELFYIGTNNRIYHNWQTRPNNGWSGENPMLGMAKQLTVGRNADGRLEIFYVGTNTRIYHNWQTPPNNGWCGEQPL
ncbi:M6 family metalloprotease domain-containing protein [Geomonas nitrogeniifigens]|uniref:M6 family metalloprotease domain-containing protein n=1 Tax=Geomonas diazotrophica TaxID=2843197 RepID=UPI001C2C2005|nr:M6 family metalloprotease domain-containing protein [Geomonas nitrogeniifigens]QXE87934.1 M6 family metalloprotease domain-containing protein [Geomonas nitrogeniifigens]